MARIINNYRLGIDDFNPYEDKMKTVQYFLNIKYHDELDEEVAQNLGNSIGAYESVPTAIYCFLRALNEIPTINVSPLINKTKMCNFFAH
jgi:poly(ADP-ribose) glycohydrolase ARH3